MDTKIEESSQYLFFKLDDEVYAINSFNVLEVVDFKAIQKVPNTNNCIKGITNIRGELVAVVDPNIRFGKEACTISKRSSFIIMKIVDKKTKENVSIALLVDLILEVDDIVSDDILDPPEFGTKIEKRFIKNIIKYKDDYVSVLKISLVLDVNELSIRG